MGFLTETMEQVRAELRARPREAPAGRLNPAPLDFRGALLAEGVSVIAEVKRSSPSAGPIASADPRDLVPRYERGGAAAISVLTDGRHFGGSIDDLRAARAVTSLPILRKDFIVDPVQIDESRSNGADAVLLIVAALKDAELEDLLAAARSEGLAALVETHSVQGLDRALAAGADIVGVNARNLETLGVDLDRALEIVARVPAGPIRVLESGIRTRDDVRRAEDAGADAVLVGETLMRSPDPAETVRELLGR
jgi:indole-3-glycerol phosphate synthase